MFRESLITINQVYNTHVMPIFGDKETHDANIRS